MQIGADKIADMRVKHLEMIQGVISRLAGQGATIKNYCITLTTAMCGFAVTLQRPLVVALALLPITVFALLDARYLQLERRFRKLFDRVRLEKSSAVPTFEISARNAPAISYIDSFFSWSIISFYLPLAVAVLAAMFIARHVYGKLV